MTKLLAELNGLVFSELGEVATPLENELDLLNGVFAGSFVGDNLFRFDLKFAI